MVLGEPMCILYNPGVGVAIGIIIGILLEFGTRFFFNWFHRPIIKVTEKNIDAWWDVETTASWSLLSKNPQFLESDVRAYRLKVINEGRSAAENVAGTIEFPDKNERRICWYEGNQATITINAKDHSFLDVYGVDLVQSNVICFPTEHGWNEIPAKAVTSKMKITLRITAKNASPHILCFEIDPKNNCKPNIVN